jgi:hypothetical protein
LRALEAAQGEVPSPGMRGGLGRVRERLYKVVTESAPMPGQDGHGDGYGNGHAIEGNGHGPAAVGTGQSESPDDQS